MATLDGRDHGPSLIRVRDLDKAYRRAGQDIHVLQGLDLDVAAGEFVRREIAVLQALGFRGASVVVSFLLEAAAIALVGGVVGGLAALPLNGLTTGTLNWQTLAHVAFAFRVTPELLALGLLFALVIGLLGGLPPAIRAARRPVAGALRAL